MSILLPRHSIIHYTWAWKKKIPEIEFWCQTTIFVDDGAHYAFYVPIWLVAKVVQGRILTNLAMSSVAALIYTTEGRAMSCSVNRHLLCQQRPQKTREIVALFQSDYISMNVTSEDPEFPTLIIVIYPDGRSD